MSVDVIAKNLLLNKTCDNCIRTCLAKEGTCEMWVHGVCSQCKYYIPETFMCNIRKMTVWKNDCCALILL